MPVLTPPVPEAPTGNPRPSGPRSTRWVLAAVAVVALGGLVAGLLVARGGPALTPPPSTTVPPTSTTSPPATTAPPVTTPATSGKLAAAVFPSPASATRFSQPAEAAQVFATEFVGFVSPLVGAFVATGADAGTVAVQAGATGVVTTVRVERIAGSWWVLGASCPDIEVASPAPSSKITSPVRLRGTSTAFEARVNVQIRQDGQQTPIATGFVMGGSMGAMGPFDGSMAFAPAGSARGALVLYTVSMRTGQLYEATVVRVAF